MLIEALASPIFIIVNAVLSIIPRISFPASFVSAMSTMFNLIAGVGYFLPLSTISDALTVYVGFFGIKFLIQIYFFFKSHIPMIN